MRGALRLMTVVLMTTALSGCPKRGGDELFEWVVSASAEFGRQPQWSPDGSRLLFGDDRGRGPGLWTWTGSHPPAALNATLPPHNWDYRWSPDGGRVCFSSPGEAGDSLSGIWVYHFNGDSVRRISDRGRDPAWLNDNLLVARIDSPLDGPGGLFEIDLDNGGFARLMDGGYLPAGSGTGWVAFSTGEIRGTLMLWTPQGLIQATRTPVTQWAWSGDGRVLSAVLSDWTSGDMTGQLVNLRFAGGNVTTDTLARWCGWPSPNRAGSKTAFVRISNARFSGVWTVSAEGGEEWIGSLGRNPSLHPTEDRIAVDVSGGGLRILTRIKA